MQTMPLISVGIPTFNRPKSLRRVLLEITKQTYSNLEIIVSDNASPDGETEDIVREIELNDPRVKYFKQPTNMGPTFNFQFVLDQSNGEFFMWAADDDWHDKNFIEVLYKKLSTNRSAIVAFSNFNTVDESGAVINSDLHFYKTLKRMCRPSSFMRQVHFFLSREGSSKPHPIYGLIRRKALYNFSWVDFVNKYGWYASDVLFVFYLIMKGPLALSDQKIFGITTCNIKYYKTTFSQFASFRFINLMWSMSKYLLGYLRISKGPVKLTLIILFPLKLIDLAFFILIRKFINKKF
jgi:glycosyltransferase involved in cell wall biosynthesis